MAFTYSQTLNRSDGVCLRGSNAPHLRMPSPKWAISGKQNWRYGMNRKQC